MNVDPVFIEGIILFGAFKEDIATYLCGFR